MVLPIALLALLVLYASLALFAFVMAERMIFPAPPPSYTAEQVPLWLKTQAGVPVPAYWLPHTEPIATILYCHGNAEDLGDIEPRLRTMNERGYQVFAFEYPGYGQAGGKASQGSVFAAADAAWQHLVTKLQVPPGDILLYGRSLGSGPSTYLASQHAARGLVHEGGYMSTFRVMTHWKLLPWDIFDNLARIGKLRCPYLSIHGWKDRTCPHTHAKKLYRAAQPPKARLWHFEAGHNDLVEVLGESYWQALESFSRTHKTTFRH
jgi:fermentation-respiration switch protein FrsA (DUF1100 family)